MLAKVHCFRHWATVVLCGPGNFRNLARRYGAKSDHICVVKCASSSTDKGFQKIVPAKFGDYNSSKPDIYADGVILTEPGTGAVLGTADCPTLILYDLLSHRIVIVHVGRAALTPINQPGHPIKNIITIALKKLIGDGPVTFVRAHVTGAICGECFVHEGEGAQRYIEPFLQFGEDVAFRNKERGQLDLPRIIRYQLTGLGVIPAFITSEPVCTHESNWLASYRRNHTKERNRIAAVLHRP